MWFNTRNQQNDIDHRLDALNFFLADVRGGLGAFVSVFLVTAAGWSPAEVGQVLTISGLIGIAAHTPLGAMIDAINSKRALLIVAVALLAVCAVAIERMPTVPVVLAADITMAMLGGIFAPTVAALTLGLVREHGFAARLARNAVFDRVGNLTIAGVIGALGWWWTQSATFYLVPIFAVVSAGVVLTIPTDAVDNKRARGFAAIQGSVQPESLWTTMHNMKLVLLAVLMSVFHFANASMLPLVGQKLALTHPGLESTLLASCILVAQLVTIPVAIVTASVLGSWGQRTLLLTACGALALRGLCFAWFDNAVILIAAQILDGIAAGIWDVLVPLILAELVIGSGRYSASRGMLGTAQGVGGSLSNVVAGQIAFSAGYSAAFMMLSACALIACVIAYQLDDPAKVQAQRLQNLQ